MNAKTTRTSLNSISNTSNSAKRRGFGSIGIKVASIITALMATFYVNAVPIFYSGTGNYYKVIAADAITWNDANTAATNSTFGGVSGHLVTLTSGGENEFVNNLRNALTGGSTAFGDTEFWIGAFQLANSVGPDDGWTWVNGEGLLNDGYTNWYVNEPNNLGGNEAFAAMGLFGSHQWNDEGNLTGIGGYIVEYAVPAPGAAALFFLGLAGLSFARRKKA
ncbi:MAG: hypothetical protein ACI96N_002142 [Arenicella sp.]|jgi:hypothetical protein